MIIALYAGILGFIYVFLTFFVIKGRFKYRVNLGDAKNEDLLRRIRAHSNFIEYVPFCLLLIFLLEYQQAHVALIHSLSVLLMAGRVMHPFGLLYKEGVSLGRTGGMMLTITTILIASFANIYLAL